MTSLRGIRVIDAAGGVAAPRAATLLASLGADVSRLPPSDDWVLELDHGPASLGRCLADAANHGKKVLAAVAPRDLGRAVEKHLDGADVLVCDWNPSRAGQVGVDLGAVRERWPGLVILAITPHGLDGPDADRPGSELTAYHAGGEGFLLPGGLVHEAVPHRPPVRAGRFLADEDAAFAGACGALAALVRREVDGTGDVVDVSIVEVQLGEGRTTLSRAWFEATDFDRSYAGYDYAGVLRCRDGWVCVRPSEERHFSAFVDLIGRIDLVADPRFATRTARFEHGDSLNVELEHWTVERDRSEVRAVLLAAGCPGGPYLEPHEVVSDEAIASRGLWVESKGGGRLPSRPFVTTARRRFQPTNGPSELGARMRGASAAGPLGGLRVLDLTWVASGPYATQLLAMAGAQVLKIESRTRPDLFRRSLRAGDDLDENIRFVDLNQAKRSICADLKSDDGLARVLALARSADVVIDNYRPGVRSRLGLGDEVLRSANPALAIVSLSGFGAAVLDADRPGYASIFSAESGLSAMTGWPDCTPADVRDTNDLRAGTLTAVAALSAVLDMLRSGEASSLDVAARDALVIEQAHVMLQASRGGEPTRQGNELDGLKQYGVFPSCDAWVAVGALSEEQRAATVERVGGSDRKQLAAWVADRPGSEVVSLLAAAGVPVAVSARASELRADPHLIERHAIRVMDHPRLGSLRVVGPPFSFASVPRRPDAEPPPLLGQHQECLPPAPSIDAWPVTAWPATERRAPMNELETAERSTRS